MTKPFVITPDEIVNQAECEAFAARIGEALTQKAAAIIVDCRKVRYMNSRAIGTLLEAYMELAERNGIIRVVGPDRVLRRGFEVVGLLSLIEIFDTMDAALVGLPA